jgi:predicted nucleic acid-binding protein
LKKIRCYLDTSVLNFFFAEDDIARRNITIKFFDQLHIIADQVCISDEVIREVRASSEPRRSQLEKLIEDIDPILLEVNTKADELSDRYIKEGIIPERFGSDAIHLAVATVNGIDVVISWNFKHIVKLKTRVMVNSVNRLMDYREIEICSPEEVIEI